MLPALYMCDKSKQTTGDRPMTESDVPFLLLNIARSERAHGFRLGAEDKLMLAIFGNKSTMRQARKLAAHERELREYGNPVPV